jgi:uncharacterized oxidoreductase
VIEAFHLGRIGEAAAFLVEQQRKVAGIDIEDATWDKLRALAGEYKLAAELDLA